MDKLQKNIDIKDTIYSLLEGEETIVNDVKSYYRNLKLEKQKQKISYEDSEHNLVIKVGESKFVYPKKAGTIIFNHTRDKVLLVNTRHYEDEMSIWSLPKGHVEKGESNWISASRETQEETGLSIDICENDPSLKLNNTVFYSYIIDEQDVEKVISDYKTDEIVECKWVSLDEIRKTKVTKETLIMCTKKSKLCQKIAKPISL